MAEISVSLFIESEDHTVEQMDTAIGVISEKSWRKGDARGRTGKVYSTHSWQVNRKCRVTDEIDEIEKATKDTLREVLNRMQGYEDHFRTVAKWGKSALRIYLVSPLIPPFIVDAAIIASIASLGVELEVEVAPQ